MAAVVAAPVHAATVNVAVAANFTAVAEEIATLFAAETEHDAVLSFGSTGQLYTQIAQGAPFGVFLAADDARPARAIAEGLAVEGTAFTYAVGQLALFSTTLDVSGGAAVLSEETFDKLAVADPELAPYGAAAIETLDALGIHDGLAEKLVTGANISQTLQFVDTGNAELGFVAASQVIGRERVWLVPADLHQPIRQDAVLLASGADNPAAAAFLGFLTSEPAVALIEAAGYAVD